MGNETRVQDDKNDSDPDDRTTSVASSIFRGLWPDFTIGFYELFRSCDRSKAKKSTSES